MIDVRHVDDDIYTVITENKVYVIEKARIVLRRGGKYLSHWLRYIVGFLTKTGQKIKICLGEADREDITCWVRGGNGEIRLLAYRLIEYLFDRLDAWKLAKIGELCLKIE